MTDETEPASEYSQLRWMVTDGVHIRRSLNDDMMKLEFSGTADDGEEYTVVQEIDPVQLLKIAQGLLNRAMEYQINRG